jgi:hypothetical protein
MTGPNSIGVRLRVPVHDARVLLFDWRKKPADLEVEF